MSLWLWAHPGQGLPFQPPCSPPGPAFWGLLNRASAPAQGRLPRPLLLAPSAALGSTLPRLVGVPGHQFTSSRAGEGEGGSSDLPGPPFPLRPRAWSCHCHGETWPLGGEGSHRVGGASCGVEEFHLYSYHTLGIWGGRGSLGHSPSMKGNQTVNGSAGALLALSPSPGVFPWEPLAL